MKQSSGSRVIPIRLAPSSDSAIDVVSLYQEQVKLYPRAVAGWYARWRWVMVWVTQVVFYGVPWLVWNGRQAVLFDFADSKFLIFGLVLHP